MRKARSRNVCFALLTVLFAAVGLFHFGCGNDDDSGSGTDTGTTTDTDSTDSETTTGMDDGVTDCAGLGLTLRSFDTSGDADNGEYDAVVGDLTFDTLLGSFGLEKSWTGCDNHVFVLKHSQIWASAVDMLIEDSPPNVHYFFVSMRNAGQDAETEADVTEMADAFDAYFATQPIEVWEQWRPRLHFVTTPGTTLGWLGELSSQFNHTVHMIGIDRFQRARDGGYPGKVMGSAWVEQVSHARYLAVYYDYESDLAEQLEAETDVMVFNVADQEDIGDEVRTLDIGTFEDLSVYDELKIELRADCPGDVGHPVSSACGEWDTVGFIEICSDPECTEYSHTAFKWITPYSNEGWWVADISSMLGWFNHGGPVYLRIRCGYEYKYTINLRFRDLDSTDASKVVDRLYEQNKARFDATINEEYQTVDFTPPTGTTKVMFHGIISGHGMSATGNCAEFCTHQHELIINSDTFETEYVMDVGYEGNAGCAMRVGEGVTPNQGGTWVYDRAAWCPGWPVAPWEVDITSAVDLNGSNTALFKSFYQDGFPPGNGGVIDADLYLSFYGPDALAAPVIAEQEPVACTSAIPSTVRDFSLNHPDFYLADLNENAHGIVTGAVESTLVDGKPVYFWAGDSSYGMDGPNYVPFTSGDSFDDWWRDVPGTNFEIDLQLDWTHSYEGTALLEQWSWYPLEPDFGFGTEGSWGYKDDDNNHYYTAEIAHSFEYQGGEMLRFSAESDLWVFINNQLVLDLGGGRHGYTDSVIDIDSVAATAGISTGNTYDIHIFVADRNHTPRFTLELPDPCI